MTPAEVEETIAIASRLRVSTLYLSNRNIDTLPESIGELTELTELHLENNQLTNLPESIGKLTNLTKLYLQSNQLIDLPEILANLTNLTNLEINGNPFTDLSILKKIQYLKGLKIKIFDVYLPHRYWTKFSEWEPEWLLDEDNAEIRRVLIAQLGYPRIWKELFEITPNNRLQDNSIDKLSRFKLNLGGNQLTNLPEGIKKFIELTSLYLHHNWLTDLPDSIGNLVNLTELDLGNNQLTSIPDSIGNLVNLTELDLGNNQLTSIPDSIGNLVNLTELDLGNNQLTSIPDSIGNLVNLTVLKLDDNQLTDLSESIENLTNLISLGLFNNKLTNLPESICKLTNLTKLYLGNNPLVDFSILKKLPKLRSVNFMGIYLPNRYWTKFCDWEPEWLLDEDNTEIKRILIEQLGYEKICAELNSITLDTWREYTLLKIDRIEAVYDEFYKFIAREPMVLLKMTCPSTAHIHILRVPPDMESAETAITWVNHGIHPDDFAVQT
jgi:leucine-rich repeat protein SHOC2